MCMSSNKIVSFEYELTSWMWEKKMSICCLKWMVLFYFCKKNASFSGFLLKTSSCIPLTQKLQLQVKNSVGLIHNNLRGLRKKYVHQNVEVCCFRKLQILIRIMMRGPYADPRPILNKKYKEAKRGMCWIFPTKDND